MLDRLADIFDSLLGLDLNIELPDALVLAPIWDTCLSEFGQKIIGETEAVEFDPATFGGCGVRVMEGSATVAFGTAFLGATIPGIVESRLSTHS